MLAYKDNFLIRRFLDRLEKSGYIVRQDTEAITGLFRSGQLFFVELETNDLESLEDFFIFCLTAGPSVVEDYIWIARNRISEARISQEAKECLSWTPVWTYASRRKKNEQQILLAHSILINLATVGLRKTVVLPGD